MTMMQYVKSNRVVQRELKNTEEANRSRLMQLKCQQFMYSKIHRPHFPKLHLSSVLKNCSKYAACITFYCR